jgi:hypothetical protein
MVREHDLAARHILLDAMDTAAGTGSEVPVPADFPTAMDRWLRPISSETRMRATQLTATALEADARGRTTRAAAILILGARGEPDASATRAAPAIAPLLDTGPHRFRLGWEPLGGRRVRVAIDLSLAQPPAFWRPRYRADRCLGGPPDATGISLRSEHEGIELVLPP